MSTSNSSWWTPPTASLPPLDGDVTSSIIFPPQSPSAAGARLESGILTVKLHCAYRMRQPSTPELTDEWPMYALFDCEDFQLSARASWWGNKRGSALWGDTFHFDVTTSPSLVIHFSARNDNAPAGQRIVPRGHITITPLPDGYPVGELRLDIEDGTGRVEVTVSYHQQKVPDLEDRKVWEILEVKDVMKKDTGRSYALAAVQLGTAGIALVAEKAKDLGSGICHPFVAPLKFAFISGKRLSLLSPSPNGGHLFHHLQMQRCFDVEKARFYAAELILILEYFHGKHMILAMLEPVHILLDAHGHIKLCVPAIYSHGILASGSGTLPLPTSLEYTAPELVAGQETTEAVDWWMLGVLLYEMLTGVPPFYHRDLKEQQHRITNRTVQISPELPSDAKDILNGLLVKDPLRRLGVHGASEIKNHPFFNGLDWQQLFQRELIPPFQPENINTVFRLEPFERDICQHPIRRLSQGIVYQYKEFGGFGVPFFWEPIARSVSESHHHPAEPSDPDEPTLSSMGINESGTPNHSLPSTDQLESALAVSLRDGHGCNTVSHILKHGMNLNTPILRYDHRLDDTGMMSEIMDEILVTPLEWATEHNRLDLVELFLQNGADANHTCHDIHGPALVRAVHRNAQIVRLLVPKTNRVSSTRALCAAVDWQDAAIVEALLTNGVRCEFEEEDLPSPLIWPSCDIGFNSFPAEAKDFLAPLVRAVRLGNAGLVQLLLAHGADANVGYHCYGGGVLSLPRRQRSWLDQAALPSKLNFSCGRAIQLAMELGHDEIVQLLMQSGANVRLPQPDCVVQGHTCPLVPRAAWLEVVSSLEGLKADMKSKA